MTQLKKDLLSIADLDREDVDSLLRQALKMKGNRRAFASTLSGMTMALIFEKPSLRTRVTFETGMYQMGGHAIYLAPGDIGLGQRESVPDAARNLSRWVDVIVARTFSHTTVEQLARYASIPVINALSDDEHPCQALADLLTVLEKWGDLRKGRIAFVGDGNNVSSSLMLLCALTGTQMTFASPVGYGLPDDVIRRAKEMAIEGPDQFLITDDPVEAVKGANAVYTDVWASMGSEHEAEQRRRDFSNYQVNASLMKHAAPDALFLHCLPAHREEEVTDEVIDGPNSVVFDQAENRLHIQKAILHRLMNVGR